ncbi:MAG: cobalt-precorrin-5B (C(1))-methyltransferase CbiD [Oscillospiraceae bacterium]|nr:cobalt-precorrin-5B (C(1))-methyltransferase CbiD [Oscillospiraceae bacterium]
MRMGYTTGSCAAAAAKAAAFMLLTGRRVERIGIVTPKGVALDLPLRDTVFGDGYVSCAVEKDGGDDPDVTTGALIYARVALSGAPGIVIDGGEGVGRVTKPGLDQPVGAAAINSVPRKMIRENVEEVCRLADHPGGLSVTIYVPGGDKIAERTFNPRLGIIGGISILGTSGIVEPMSEQALIDTIHVELRQRRALGAEYILLTPGNYGADYLSGSMGVDRALPIRVSNFIGDSLSFCAELGFRGILLVGHVGKLVKLAGGILNTHSKYGDRRMEILCRLAKQAGVGGGDAERILECVSCDEALRIIESAGLSAPVLSLLAENIASVMKDVCGASESGAIVFSNQLGFLCRTRNAPELLKKITEG